MDKLKNLLKETFDSKKYMFNKKMKSAREKADPHQAYEQYKLHMKGKGRIKPFDEWYKEWKGNTTSKPSDVQQEGCKCEGKCKCGMSEMMKPPTKKGGTISTGKIPSFNDDIDIPATGFTHHRVKANAGKQHHITAYDDMWEEKDEKEKMKLKNLFKKKKSKKNKKVDEYVAQSFKERDKVIGMIPFSTRNEVFDGVVERKSGDQYFVKPDQQSLGKLDTAVKGRLKDGIWLDANQLKKKSTLTMTGLNP